VPDQHAQQALLFTPGARLGWVFRERRQLITPYPEPRPDQRLLAEQAEAARELAARRYANTRRWLGLPSASIAIIAVVLAGCARAANPQANFAVAVAYTAVLCGPGLTAMAWTWYRSTQAQDADRGVEREFEYQTGQWQARAAEYERAELARLAAIPEWVSAEPPAWRTDVFGGSLAGWQALLTTHGTSILADRPLLVIDLSAQYAVASLLKAAQEAGVPQQAWVLPRDLDRCGLLAGLTSAQLADVLAEALHAGAPRSDRVVDIRVVERLTGALTSGITPARLAAATQAALGHRVPPGMLNDRELERLAHDLFPVSYRHQVATSLIRLDAFLSDLARPEYQVPGRPAAPEPAHLTCLAIEPAAHSARAEMLIALAIGWLAVQVSATPATAPAVIIAGADGIRRPLLERLAGACEYRGVSLTMLYRHLREDAVALLGGGAAAFMRLGNHAEAEQAAAYLGRGHRFTLSSRTVAISGAQRASEFAVEPAVLQNLPDHALLLAGRRPGAPGLRSVECNPAIASGWPGGLPQRSPGRAVRQASYQYRGQDQHRGLRGQVLEQ
jgi:hypothetical protein